MSVITVVSASPHDRTGAGRPDSPILQAALDLALHGLPWAAAGDNGSGVCQCYVFPVSRNKVPCTSSDRHPSERPRYGATRSQVKIRNNFREYPRGNLGVEAGVDFFVVDPDTIEGHPGLKPGAGLPALEELVAKMGGWPATRIAITPTGGRHYYWRVPPGITIGSRKFLDGVEIVGMGGVVVLPPSVAPIAKGSRELGTYRWGNDLPIAEPPSWLVDRCKVDQQERFSSDSDDEHDPDKVCAALNAIRNDAQQDYDNNDWYRIGLSAYRGAGNDELVWIAFNNLSARRKDKYDLRYTQKRWKAFHKDRNGSIKVDTLYWFADQSDPQWRNKAMEAAIASAFAPIPDDGAAPLGTNGANGASAKSSVDPVLPAWPNVVPPPPKCSLDETHAVFRKWLGEHYDMDALNATAAAAASERLTGDPLWLLLISGPANAKTETVQALMGSGAHVTSTIASEGALLSATPQRSRTKKATGGLLRKIGSSGVLVIKDVTSILSADRNIRAMVLAAIREIYDGRWERNVGSDGGQTLTWIGRIVIIGAVTTAWDTAHTVVSAMGDRFVLIRINSNLGRVQSGRMAINNTGSEIKMRKELSDAMGGLVLHASTEDVAISDDETELLLKAADIVTMARTAVERDYQGEVLNSHAPEMPTRFAKQLTQMVRGAVAIGMTRKAAMALALRCARDSIPPLRLDILLDVAKHSGTTPGDVRKRINKPWRTVKREMDGLYMLGILKCDEEYYEAEGDKKTKWHYDLNDDEDSAGWIDRVTLLSMAPPSADIPF